MINFQYFIVAYYCGHNYGKDKLIDSLWLCFFWWFLLQLYLSILCFHLSIFMDLPEQNSALLYRRGYQSCDCAAENITLCQQFLTFGFGLMQNETCTFQMLLGKCTRVAVSDGQVGWYILMLCV